jgi:hypothetical protein
LEDILNWTLFKGSRSTICLITIFTTATTWITFSKFTLHILLGVHDPIFFFLFWPLHFAGQSSSVTSGSLCCGSGCVAVAVTGDQRSKEEGKKKSLKVPDGPGSILCLPTPYTAHRKNCCF